MIEEFNARVLPELRALKQGLKSVSLKGGAARELLTEQLMMIAESVLVIDRLRAEFSPGSDSAAALAFELNFHKSVYPEFKSLQLYCQERYGLMAELPAGNVKELRRYYTGQLSGIDRFFHRHQFHYGYYCLKATELDGLFFSSGADPESSLLPVLLGDVPAGATATGYLFALFMAFERLRVDLLSLIAELDAAPPLSGVSVTEQGRLRRPLQWTEDVIHLIELAHGIHLMGAVNGGELGVVEFFEALGEFFGVNLGVPKSGFDDLKKRKRLSKTHFTDQLREALRLRMDEEDKWEFSGSVKKRPY